MGKKRVSPKIKHILKLFAERLEEEGIKVNSLILFGSQAKGNAKSYSDIDVCVISPFFGKDELEEATKLRLQAYNIDWRIEPHPLNQRDLKIKSNPFVHEILSTGIKIH